MSLLKSILPYFLAGSIFFSPVHEKARGPKFSRIKKSNNTIELSAINNTDSLESLVNESFWGKDVKKTARNVPILMYHDIGKPGEYGQRYCVGPEIFRKQLKSLYDNGFISVSLSEYVNGEYKFLQPDKKPVVITFDDATKGQFRYLENKFGRIYIDPDCAIAILHDFNKKHPDFRLKATFFIDFVNTKGNFQVPFAQPGYEVDKIKKIIDLGMEIGNHSLEHINLKKTKSKDINNNMKFLDYIINLIRPDYQVESFAYPYGAVPKTKPGKNTINNYFKYACIGWGGIAPDVDSKRFNRYRIPRIEINNDLKNLKKYVLNK